MTQQDRSLLDDLDARGLIAQFSGGDDFMQHISGSGRTVYCGFDPTADSLHIGHLVPLLVLKRFQLAGHQPIALVGGATGLVGDPSFKAQERSLNTADVVAGWADKIKSQVEQFVDFEGAHAARVVNNLDWTGEVRLLDFLRDVGKYFAVNAMIQKESVRQRIEREGEGISFTEFSYMLLQSYDFAQLNRHHGCTVQLGGSDQWGNITGGIDLTRRMNGAQVFGMTLPLVTKADGTKFGKTEGGTVWLDGAKTSPYSFYQFWLNTADADVYKFLRYFTFLSVEEIDAIEKADAAREGRPEAQRILAREVTRTVHGEDALTSVERINSNLFSGGDAIGRLGEQDLAQLKLDGMPYSRLERGALPVSLTQLLSDIGMASSGKQVKDALTRRAVDINGVAIGFEDNAEVPRLFDATRGAYGRYYLIKLGKKKYHLLELV